MMPVSNSTNRDDGDGALSPADLELFSLFMLYPDMTFDPEEPPQAATNTRPARNNNNIESSPLSTALDDDTKNSSLISASTARTTPLRPLALAELDPPLPRSWTEYLHRTQRNDLPQECRQYFTALGQCIVNIGSALFGSSQYTYPLNVSAVGDWLRKKIQYSCDQVNGQINRIAYSKTLLAFTCRPAEAQMWSTYQQRARLILANTSLPSQSELNLLEALAFLYDAYVYNLFLQKLFDDAIDDKVSQLLNDLYNDLMTWLSKYRKWCHLMQELRYRYMKPLIGDIANCPTAHVELDDFQRRLTQARAGLTKPVNVDKDVAEEKLVKALNLSARRLGAEKGIALRRTRTRYKREHTL